MRSSVCARSSSSSGSLFTFFVAPCAAIARPSTSPSLDSRLVSSAIPVSPFRLFAAREPGCQHRRQAALAHFGLGPFDLICDPPEGRETLLEVEQEPRGARIAIARLPDRSRIQEPAACQLDLGARLCETPCDRPVRLLA